MSSITFIVNTLLWRVKLHAFPLKGITCVCCSWQLTWMNSNCQLCFLGRNLTFTEVLGIYIMQEPVRDVGSANTQNPGSSHWICPPLNSLFPLAVVALKLFTFRVEPGFFSSCCCCCQVASVVFDSVWPHRRQPTSLPPSLGFSRQELWTGLPLPSPVQESEKWKWSHSVMSDSSRPHGLKPTRLLRPWDFPGKSAGVGCHRLLH